MLKAKDKPVLTATHAVVNANSGKEEGVSIRDTLTECVEAAGGTLTLHEVHKGDDLPAITRKALDAGATTVVGAAMARSVAWRRPWWAAASRWG